MDTKQTSKLVREELKRILPDWKFSVTIQRFSGGSSIDLSLMQGPEEVSSEGYAQLNPHSFGSQSSFYGKDKLISNGCQLTPKGWEVMEIATKVLSSYHWDNSDIQTDYFHCNFYLHINIGKWNKNYEVMGGLPFTPE